MIKKTHAALCTLLLCSNYAAARETPTESKQLDAYHACVGEIDPTSPVGMAHLAWCMLKYPLVGTTAAPESTIHEIIYDEGKLRCWYIESTDETGAYTVKEHCEKPPADSYEDTDVI